MLWPRPGRTVAEIIGTFCCAVFFGAAAYISLVQQPAALETGSDFAVRFFAPMYRRASLMQASLAILGAVAAVVAYFFGAGRSWLLAAVLISSVIPFTLLIVEPVNDQIRALDPSAERAIELLTRWGRLHWVRTAISGAAFVLCLAAMVDTQTGIRGRIRHI
jgi:uncharacterized membrane protein